MEGKKESSLWFLVAGIFKWKCETNEMKMG